MLAGCKKTNNNSSTPSSTVSSSKPVSTEMPAVLKSIKGIEKYTTTKTDYTLSSNWVARPTNPTKDVDAIFFYPTGFSGSSNGDKLSDINDPTMYAMANISVQGQASVFSQSCNVYAPLYRQFTVDALLKVGTDETLTYCAQFDIYKALDYYFQNCNNGRPFILAGHSQGSVWLLAVLQDYMKQHPEYLKRMVAAYAIGFSVTKDYLKKNPHLKFATGATDTGVIISYNTEGPNNSSNIVVLEGSVAINPINWKTDDTYASKSQNLGSLNHATASIGSGVADARLDTKRGVVICESVTPSQYAMLGTYFGKSSYHTYDYSFYYANLVKNVADRIAAFKKK
jgi:hypothetical protein